MHMNSERRKMGQGQTGKWHNSLVGYELGHLSSMDRTMDTGRESDGERPLDSCPNVNINIT